ncbi:GAP1-N1 domain-containing protein [Sideroxydans sp.]
MIQPLRARYGAKNNSHELLEWQGQTASLPSALLGLTDKPPGHLVQDERWWPSLGCGAVGDWWALWWTVPDDAVSRGGMVRSEVALWPLNEIGAVNDLRPVLASLSGWETIPTSPSDLLHAVAEALVSSEIRQPPVVSDLDVWAGTIADLWSRLWPDARRGFSARVAVIPPQGGESVAPPLLYCVPTQRLPGWSDFPVIRTGTSASPTSRAALWLIGKEDLTISEILDSCNLNFGDLKKLASVARAADRLDRLREFPSPINALELLRSLAVLAPSPAAAKNIKIEALSELELGLNVANPEFVFMLKNLDPASLPDGGHPSAALTSWVYSQAPHLTLDEARQLFTGLGENKAQDWWQASVRKALHDGFAKPDNQWAKIAINWLGLPDCAKILEGVLPSTETVESRLLDVATELTLPKDVLQHLQTQSVVRLWSRLHAWAVMSVFSPSQAFEQQRKFSGNVGAGLKYLVSHLSGKDVVNAVIDKPDSQFIQLVAQRTAREPYLLQDLDTEQAAWLELWAAHIAAGGDNWPPKINHVILGEKLLKALLSGGKEPSGLIAPLARDLAGIAFNLSDREKLWGVLKTDSRAALLPLVADVLIQACNAGQAVHSPEPQLAQEVLKRVRATGFSIKVFVLLLSSNVSLDEQDLIRCISASARTDWIPAIAEAVRKAVLNRRWKEAAEYIYDRFMSGGIPELSVVVDACQVLLSPWQRIRFAIKTGNTSLAPNIEESLAHRVAELGGDLAPGELDDIWERAGGKRKDLITEGTPASRWQAASNLAKRGKLKGGMLALVRELENSHPYNPDLKELANVLSKEQN